MKFLWNFIVVYNLLTQVRSGEHYDITKVCFNHYNTQYYDNILCFNHEIIKILIMRGEIFKVLEQAEAVRPEWNRAKTYVEDGLHPQ